MKSTKAEALVVLVIIAGMPIKDSSLDNTSGRKHPVPQNVMDVEFKVVGDLTLRQVLYIALGGILAYLSYRAGLPSIWKWSFVVFFSLLGVAVAFVPIQERGLDKWIVIFIRAMFSPTQMIWMKSYSPPSYFLSDYASIIKNEIITLTPVKSRSKLEAYLDNIQESEDPLDSMQSSRVNAVKSQFSDISLLINEYNQEQQTPTLVVPVLSASPKKEDPKPQTPERVVETNPTKETESLVAEPPQESNSVVEQTIPSFEEMKEDEIKSKNELLGALADIEGGYNQEGPIEVVNTSEYNRPINLSSQPSSTGEINIKGLRKLPPIIIAEDIKGIKVQEESLEKKVSELLEIAKKVRKKYNLDPKNQNIEEVPTISSEPDQVKSIKDRFSELRAEKEKLTNELQKSDEQIQLLKNDSKNTDSLEKQIEVLARRNKELEDMLKQIHGELFRAKQEQEEGFVVDKDFEKSASKISTAKDNSIRQDNTDTTQRVNPRKINIIEGIVKNSQGELLENVVVLIKDNEGNVLRALKTNKLGQFTIQSPIQNGKYIVEAIKGGMQFDTLVAEAKGETITPLYFVAK